MLEELQGMYVKQSFDQKCISCTVTTYYDYYGGDIEGNQLSKEPLFSANSQMCYFMAQYSGRQRAMSYHTKIYQNVPSEQVKIISIDKDYDCTEIKFTTTYMGVEIGFVQLGFGSCCSMNKIELCEPTGKILYYILPVSLCQCGLMCQCPCQSCNSVLFDVYDENDKKISQIKRVTPQCLKYCWGGDDYFRVPLPKGAHNNIKALFMTAVIVLDRTYFYMAPLDNGRQESY